MKLRYNIPDMFARGFWVLFGGQLDPGETPEQVLRRELLEEISWQPDELQFCMVHHIDRRAAPICFLQSVPLEQLRLLEGQDMVAAAMKAVFVIQAPDQVSSHWQRVTEMLRKQFPTAVPVMEAARDDVLAFMHFYEYHWLKIWGTDPLERLNVAPRGAPGSAVIKHRTNVVGVFPNDAAIVRLMGSELLEQQEEWQLQRRRLLSEATLAKIPEPEEALELTDADATAQPATSKAQLKPTSSYLDLHRTNRSLSCQFSDQG